MNVTKEFAATILATVLLVFATTTVASAITTVTLSPGDNLVLPQGEVVLDLKVSDPLGIAIKTFHFELNVNPQQCALIFTKQGESEFILVTTSSDISNGGHTMQVAGFSLNNPPAVRQSTILARVTLKASATDAVQTCTLGFSGSLKGAADQDISYIKKASSFKLLPIFPIKGDVKTDGVLDINDAIKLARIVLGVDLEPLTAEVADFDGNGEININDAIALARQVLGIDPVSSSAQGGQRNVQDLLPTAWSAPQVQAVHMAGGRLMVSVQSAPLDSVRLEVFDLNGRTVFYSETQTTNNLRWNLLDQGGGRVANGVYLYRVLAQHPDGKVSHSRLHKLVVLH